MEKIAIISDIHSNITAFKTVLEDIEKRKIKRIFCLGDLTLKGSSPCEVLDLAKEKCEVIVKGNTDDSTVNDEGKHYNWHREKLGKERIKFLDNLPMYYDFYMSGSLIRMFHASKNDLHYRVTDFDTVENKMKLFEDENNVIPDIVLYGDIHIQYMQKFYNKTLVNVGSVGNVIEFLHHDETIEDMSETLQAYYTILEGEFGQKTGKSSLSIQFVRVPYDINKEIELAKKNNSISIENYILELTTAIYRRNKKKLENSKEYWDKGYWEKNIQDNKTDFLKDNWMEKYISEIEKVEDKKAIDLGCGLGQDTKWLLDKGFDVLSCDISSIALEKLKELIPNSKTMQLDVKEKLPFEDNSIGLIDANLSIHYFDMKNTISIFNEIYRVLKPNGLFIGRVNSDKNETYVKETTKKIEDNFYYDYDRYYRLFNKEQFDILTKDWNVIVLNENITVRLDRKKALWEFILKK